MVCFKTFNISDTGKLVYLSTPLVNAKIMLTCNIDNRDHLSNGKMKDI